MEKSYVSMENRVCPVCGIQHSHECGILMDRRLKNSMERTTVTGWGLCEKHDKLHKDGYIALVVANNPGCDTITLESANRTGEVAHVKRDAFEHIFGRPAPDIPLCFVGPEVGKHLKKIYSEVSR